MPRINDYHSQFRCKMNQVVEETQVLPAFEYFLRHRSFPDAEIHFISKYGSVVVLADVSAATSAAAHGDFRL